MSNRENHINFINPSMDCLVTTESFVSYYTSRFESDLRRFYDITNDFGDHTFPFVLEMPCRVTNLRRKGMAWDDLNHYYMFSAAVSRKSSIQGVINSF